MRKRWLLGCTVLLGLAGSALAGDRKVPEQYATIQAAVNASVSGDVVVCAPGTYTEAVVATKSNITITGTVVNGIGCTWDGGTGEAAKTCLELTGDANVVTGFTFKNGLDQCRLKGKYCKVKSCKSSKPAKGFCRIEGDYGTVESCEVREAVEVAVKVVGKSCAVVSTDVYDCLDVGIDLEGDSCQARSCEVVRCKKGGIRCKKPEGRPQYCVVKNCRATSCGEFGFHFEADVGTCSYNTATLCGESTADDRGGFRCIGDDNYCHYNFADRCKGDGFRHRGNWNWCYANEAYACERDGQKHEGDDNDCDYPWSEDCGRDGHEFKGKRNSCYVPDSHGNGRDGHRFEGDDNDCDYGYATGNGRDGYNFDGDRNDFYDCSGRYSGDDGFDCEGGSDNSMRYCDARYNKGAGCENGGSSTDLTACVFLYNAVDIGLDGGLGASFGTLSLNAFGSGSIFTILTIGLGL